jgi:hypothetical protein
MLFKNYVLWILITILATALIVVLIPGAWQYVLAPAVCISVVVKSCKKVCDNGLEMKQLVLYPGAILASLIVALLGLILSHSVLLANGLAILAVLIVPIILLAHCILSPTNKSFVVHLGLCSLVVIIAGLIALIPGAWPYTIAPTLAICFGVISMWYVVNFGLSMSAIIFNFLLIVATLIIFIIGGLDWIFKWEFLNPPLKYIAATEGLPVALILSIFLGSMFREADILQ